MSEVAIAVVTLYGKGSLQLRVPADDQVAMLDTINRCFVDHPPKPLGGPVLPPKEAE